jgi:hypothetical protein
MNTVTTNGFNELNTIEQEVTGEVAQRPVHPDSPPAATASGGDAEVEDMAPEEDPADEEAHEGEAEPHPKGRLAKKIDVFNRFIDSTQRGLEPTTALLWLTLLKFAWDGVVKVDQEKIAAALGLTTRTVQRHLELLYSLKLVKKTREGGNGRGVNWYRLGLQSLPCRPKKNKKKPAPK